MIQTEVSALINNGINFYTWYQMAYLHTMLVSSALIIILLHKFMPFKLFLKCIFTECHVKALNVFFMKHKLQMYSLHLQHSSTTFRYIFFLNFHTAFYPLPHPRKASCMRKVSSQQKRQAFMGMYGLWSGVEAAENFTASFLTRAYC